MKKLLAIILAVVMLFSITACDAAEDVIDGALDDVVDTIGDAANKEISRGTVTGNVYTSEFSGITFTTPDTWTFYSDEEIASAMNMSADLLDKDTFAQKMAQTATVYDMMAVDSATGCNVNMSYENLKLTAGDADYSESDYLEAVKKQSESQTAMTITFGETADVTLGGHTYLRCITDVDYSGVSMQQVYYMRNIDGFMHGIVVTLVNGTTVETIENMFS